MSDPNQTAAYIAAKRAEVQAKLAKFAKPGGNAPQTTTAAVSPSASRSGSISPALQTGTSTPSSNDAIGGGGARLDLIQKKIAEAKARLASSSMSMPRATVSGIRSADGKAALGSQPKIGLDESGHIDLKAMLENIPKREIMTAKANQRQVAAAAKKESKALKVERPKEDVTTTAKNPYFDPALAAKTAPKIRKTRPLKFVQPGKYIQQGNQVRAKAQLEKLKEEIAQNVKKAGMEVELDISDKAIKKEPPPPAEWWDAPFLANKSYDDLDKTPVNPDELGQLVTLYVHHPIPVKPPNEPSGPPVVRSLMLTKKERKKLRRQRRQEAQKEKQDKIRLGLLPPDPPKVKISNLMRVLGQEAIQDPTKIEAKVRREMAQRQRQHELANEQRKLTPEERRAKILKKLKEDRETSNEVAVFKVKNCAHPKLRFKIEKNAQQYQITGMVIVHPKCHLVIAEGGPKSIKAYKKLMLRRIDWNELPPPKNPNAMADQQPPNVAEGENKCFLVWEGQVKNKAFRKFTWKPFESEKMAREELAKWNVEHYWDAAVMASDEELAARQPTL